MSVVLRNYKYFPFTFDSIDQMNNRAKHVEMLQDNYYPENVKWIDERTVEINSDKIYQELIIRRHPLDLTFNINKTEIISFGGDTPTYRLQFKLNVFQTYGQKVLNELALRHTAGYSGGKEKIKLIRTNKINVFLFDKYSLNKRDPLLDFSNEPYSKITSAFNIEQKDGGSYYYKAGIQFLWDKPKSAINDEGKNPRVYMLDQGIPTFGGNGIKSLKGLIRKGLPVKNQYSQSGSSLSYNASGLNTINWYVWKGKTNDYICFPEWVHPDFCLAGFDTIPSQTNSENYSIFSTTENFYNVKSTFWNSHIKYVFGANKNFATNKFVNAWENTKENIENIIMKKQEWSNQDNFVGIFKLPNFVFSPEVFATIFAEMIFTATNKIEEYLGCFLAFVIPNKVFENYLNKYWKLDPNYVDIGRNFHKLERTRWNSVISIPNDNLPTYNKFNRIAFLDKFAPDINAAYINNRNGYKYLALPSCFLKNAIFNDSKGIYFNRNNTNDFWFPPYSFLENKGIMIDWLYINWNDVQSYPESQPFIFNSFYQYLNSIKNTTNTSFQIAKQQAFFNSVSSGFQAVTSLATGGLSAAGAVGAVSNQVSNVLGVYNKKRMIEAQVADAKNSTSISLHTSIVDSMIKNNILGTYISNYDLTPWQKMPTFRLSVGNLKTKFNTSQGDWNEFDTINYVSNLFNNTLDPVISQFCLNQSLIQLPITENSLNEYLKLVYWHGQYLDIEIDPKEIKELFYGQFVFQKHAWEYDHNQEKWLLDGEEINEINVGAKWGAAPFWYFEIDVPRRIIDAVLCNCSEDIKNEVYEQFKRGLRLWNTNRILSFNKTYSMVYTPADIPGTPVLNDSEEQSDNPTTIPLDPVPEIPEPQAKPAKKVNKKKGKK